MTEMYMLDVFGGRGFLAKATNHLGLRDYVLDTKFGPRYDVTNPLVLTGILTGRLRWQIVSQEGFSPSGQHTACSFKVMSASAAIV